MTDIPLVSILIPAWNAGPYIAEAIESCRRQTYPAIEICVAEDSSDDDTYERAKEAAGDDPWCKVGRFPHGGQASSLNHALAMSTGDIIARIDADDSQYPERIAAQVEMLFQGNADIVTCGMAYMDEHGNIIKLCDVGPFDGDAYLEGKCSVCNASSVSWRQVWERVGQWSAEHDVSCDTDWNLRTMAIGFRRVFLNRLWYFQRRHPGQMTKRLGTEMTAKFAELTAKYKAGGYAR